MKNLPIKSDSITNRDGRLQSYLNQLDKPWYEPLSPAEEKVVIDLYLQKDISARDILIKRNLRYVVYVAKVYQQSWSSTSDLISTGNMGLVKGVNKIPFNFNPNKYTRLINFLSWYIQGAIVNFLYEHKALIRLPFHVINMKIRMDKLQEKFLQENTWEMADDDLTEKISDSTNFQAREVRKLLNHPNTFIGTGDTKKGRTNMDTLTETEESYENIIPSESDECLADYTTVKESNNIQIRRILKSMLSPRENEIISAYFGLEGPEITVEHISNKYDIAMERIRQIKERCIKRLQLNSQSREQLRCLW